MAALPSAARPMADVHEHDAGWWRSNWNYFTDKSVDEAAARLAQAAPGGLNADHVMDFIRSATDFDQMTYREARMMYAVLTAPSYSGHSISARRWPEQLCQ